MQGCVAAAKAVNGNTLPIVSMRMKKLETMMVMMVHS